jgi:nitrate reductase gamma subunit
MYALAIGPLLWIAVGLFVGGLIYRIARLRKLTILRSELTCTVTRAKDEQPVTISEEEQKLEKIARFQNSVMGKHPVMVIVSFIFHLGLLVTPFFVMAHNVMLRRALGISLPSLPDSVCHILTTIVLAGAVFFLVRRLAVPKVFAISDYKDYVVLLITALPFLTGFMAHQQLLDARTVITAHILAGELMLAAIPFTKIGHMVFFFFMRSTLAGEYCLGRGNRTWATETR